MSSKYFYFTHHLKWHHTLSAMNYIQSKHWEMWKHDLKHLKGTRNDLMISLVVAKFFSHVSVKRVMVENEELAQLYLSLVQSVCESGYIWHTVYMHFMHSGEEGCRSLSLCSRASLTWVSPSWRSVKAVPSAQDSSDRRSDSRGRTEELTQTLVEGCHLLNTSLNTCEYQKPLGTLVRRKKYLHR